MKKKQNDAVQSAVVRGLFSGFCIWILTTPEAPWYVKFLCSMLFGLILILTIEAAGNN